MKKLDPRRSCRNSTTRIMRRISRCSRSPATSRPTKPLPPPKNISARGPSSTSRPPCRRAHRPLSGQHIWLIDKPDAVQTQIRVGQTRHPRAAIPNYIPVAVMNRIFGGGYNSRLNTEVRVKKGLTYGAYSSFNPHRYAGSFARRHIHAHRSHRRGHEAGGGSDRRKCPRAT